MPGSIRLVDLIFYYLMRTIIPRGLFPHSRVEQPSFGIEPWKDVGKKKGGVLIGLQDQSIWLIGFLP